MSLPAYEDQRASRDWWPEKIVTPETKWYVADAARLKHDIVINGAFVGMCETAIALGETGPIDIHEGMEVGTDHLTDDATQNVFNVVDAEVWVDPITMLCYDTYVAGRYGIGQLVEVKDADGVITFKKRRYFITEPAVTPST